MDNIQVTGTATGTIELDGVEYHYNATLRPEDDRRGDKVEILDEDGNDWDFGDDEMLEELVTDAALDHVHAQLRMYSGPLNVQEPPADAVERERYKGGTDPIRDDETLDQYLARKAKDWHPEELRKAMAVAGRGQFAPLLHTPWKAGRIDPSRIEGAWAEDSSEYHLYVPEQIRDLLVELQNILAAGYYKQQGRVAKSKAMYMVDRLEIHAQPVMVEATSPEEAIQKAAEGEGAELEDQLYYVDPSEWPVSKVKG